ncbi:hypothetical protein IQ249_13275 [Lusitaniella coriacea LEGE 07157]|uniref:Uncharacterized protein n=1 Tax=Lusitaniella coriacea LEGE 07157 TaxID=945747 RepID=A0A8J7DX27_9CYAN|nr:hypothetical protein [Lusitaniella coriacea]MBE9116872.1 hypothetical protein [Lusitaniella coriacea LEGE 07157]
MIPEILSFLIGAATFFLYALTVLILLRLPLSLPPIIVHFSLALVIHIITVLTCFIVFETLPYWHGAALYWFCFNLYLFAYSAVYKSISLNILLSLARRPSQSATIEEISAIYVQPSFQERIEILQNAGYVLSKNSTFELTQKGKHLARRIAVVQRLFGIEQSGLYSTVPDPKASQ